ncbi:MAG: DUF805 domain-containing protein [Rhodobacterales bacterium]|nr:DUF805 domain-containing protein [Rhodobacterales bacterium]
MSKPVFEDLFTFSGRRNRLSYLLYSLAVTGLGGFIYYVLADMIGLIAFVLMIPLIISSWAVGGQRCRDFGWSGWAVLIILIPYIGGILGFVSGIFPHVGGIFAILIMFIPGIRAENRYGPDPLASLP